MKLQSLWATAACALAVLGFGVTALHAQSTDESPPGSQALERSRIQQERAGVERRFETEELVCYQRFAVSDCLRQARAARRDALAGLRRQELSLNEAQARANGADQLLRLEQRQSIQSQQVDAGRRAEAIVQHEARYQAVEDKSAARQDALAGAASREEDQKRKVEQQQKTRVERLAKEKAAAAQEKKYAERQAAALAKQAAKAKEALERASRVKADKAPVLPLPVPAIKRPMVPASQ